MANNMANVWAQMGYVPPRGQCNYKQSLMSPRCPCLRFMLHPLKSSSSYECDGCNHHASFHSMENKAEDEIRKKWEQEAKDKAQREEEEAQRPKKRPRAIGYRNDTAPAQTAKEKHALTVEDQETQDRFDTMVHGIEHDIEQWGGQYRTEAAAKAALGDKYGVRPKSKRRAAATRAASRITELDGQDDVIEL